MKTGRPIYLNVVIAIIPALVFLTACDEDSPASPKDHVPAGPVASSVEELLEEVFENAYNTQDSIAYAAMLDTLYEFELLPDDPGDPLNMETWDLADELRIAGRMFSGWTNADGIRVIGIDLNIALQGKVPSTDLFQDQPGGQVWYKAIAEVDLTVITHDPNANDGSGITNREVNSNQDFIVRPDPNSPGLWVIRRQVDREPISKYGTEEASWSEIKSLFK